MNKENELSEMGKLDLALELAERWRAHEGQTLEFLAGFAITFLEEAGYERDAR
jgi:hypothetical protein